MRLFVSEGCRTLPSESPADVCTPIGRVCVVTHSQNVKLDRRTARAFAVDIYRWFTGPGAPSPNDRIGSEILD
jgi:hypothetical protein